MKQNKLFRKLLQQETLLQAWEHVKRKSSSGGIDGQSIDDFEKDLVSNITTLISDLSKGTWCPEPYLSVSIPKKGNERRRLGLLCTRDKIVQQAIRILIEPAIDETFKSNSYGYRSGKGPVKAIRKALSECKKNEWAVKLDIDNYFDNIDHDILESKLSAVITDTEIVRG